MSKLFTLEKEQSAKKSPAMTRTENGALTLATSGSNVLDLFSRGGAMRQASEKEIENVLAKAYKEQKELAVAILFYLRDVLQGQGERRFFRVGLRWLATKQPTLVKALLPMIPEYGRWDDLFALRGINNKGENLYHLALHQMGTQLLSDAAKVRSEGDSASISLAAKWAPSERAGKASRPLAFELMKSMGLTARQYRKLLVFLRKHLDVVERKMCSKAFDKIRYESVPSRAAMIYRNAFSRNDRTRYSQFLDAVKAGEKGIKAATLYPYDIVANLRQHYGRGTDDTLELQWKALPHYDTKGLAIVDTSGSMTWTAVSGKAYPIDVAASLAIYMAERNTSIFKDKFITFSDRPTFITMKGKTLKDKINELQRADVGGSTNLQAVFDMILELAVENNLPEDEMPDILYIFSDMEFNIPTNPNARSGWAGAGVQGYTNLEVISKKYKAAGYKRPNIIFWNVQSRNAQSPAAFDDKGTALFSGCSPALFKIALEGELNPIKAMLSAIDTPRYHPIMELVASV